jgi:hypothetical protein
MSQFMNTPNADLYALLAQEAAQNRLRGGGGTNVGAGSSSEIDILTAQGDLAERAAQREHGRDYSKSHLMLGDTMAQRQHMRGMEMKGLEQANARELLGLEQSGLKERLAIEQAGALDQIRLTNEGRMDVAAFEAKAAAAALEKEAELNLRNEFRLAELKLAAQQATGDKAVQIQQEIDALEKEGIAREQKMQAVQRRIAEGNPQAKLELQSASDRLQKLMEAQAAVKTNFERAWDKDGASIMSDFKATVMATPAMNMWQGMGEGIMTMREGLGEAMGDADKVSDTAIRYAFGLPLAKGLHEGANYDALAAAVRSGRVGQKFGGALLDAVSTGRGDVWGQLSSLALPEYDKAANKFALKGMTDLFFKTLAGSGLSVDAVSGRAEVEKLLGLLMDTSTATNLDVADFQKSVRDRLMSASQAMYGTRAGDSSPQLVEALYAFVDKVGTAKAGSILNEKGGVDVDSVRNAAMQYVFERAASLRSALDAGTGKAYFTHKNLTDALARLNEVRTGDQFEPALLLRGQSQTDETLRQLIGAGTMGRLSALDTSLQELRGLQATESDLKLRDAQKKAELKRALESATLAGNKEQLRMIRDELKKLEKPAP